MLSKRKPKNSRERVIYYTEYRFKDKLLLANWLRTSTQEDTSAYGAKLEFCSLITPISRKILKKITLGADLCY
jgi:hypothetical protein